MDALQKVVSVCMITYNHESYIEAAIEGILMQEVDFEIEIIIANDASSDKTHQVIENLIAQHPKKDLISYFNHSENLGMMPNFIFALNKCKGKYIALCEGDDYWIDPLKLQKQVDFLEHNHDYSICFHKVKLLRGTLFEEDISIQKRFDQLSENDATIKDLVQRKNFIHTASVVYRNHNIVFPMEYKYTPIGDYFLHILNSEFGKIKRLDEKMSVYRLGVGVFSSLSSAKMLEKIIVSHSCLVSYLKEEHHKELFLKRIIRNVNRLSYKFSEPEYLSEVLDYKIILKIIILKIKRLFV